MISVIIPVYNVEKYLCECIDSVLGQTYQDYEVILVDDGSTDSSGTICDKYAETNSRIKVIHRKNGGLSEARNTGFDAANGEYIYFLDIDDYIRADALERMHEASKKTNADIYFFEAEVFYDDKENVDNSVLYERKSDYGTISSGKAAKKMMLENEFYTAVPLHLYRRQYLIENKIRFYPGILHEDNLFSPLAFVRAKSVTHIHDKLYYRRMRSGSIMTTKFDHRNFHGYCVSLISLLKEINKHSYETDKRDFLELFILHRVRMILGIYVTLSKEERVTMENDFKKLRNALRVNSYLGDKKIKIKFESIEIYIIYIGIKKRLKKRK